MNWIEAIETGTAIGFACGIGLWAFILTVYGMWCVCSWTERLLGRGGDRAEARAHTTRFRRSDGE